MTLSKLNFQKYQCVKRIAWYNIKLSTAIFNYDAKKDYIHFLNKEKTKLTFFKTLINLLEKKA